MNPKLRFNKEDILEIAGRYEYPLGESEAELIALRPFIQQRGYLLKSEMEKVAYWKAPRSSGNIRKSSEHYINEITSFALKAFSERARIEVLTVLDGVRWPTASVILHFFHKDFYPIIDFRALWSVSLDVPKQYNFEFWWTYVEFCRSLSNDLHVDMRTLDRALWQYSKEHQKSSYQKGATRADPHL